MRKEEPPAQSYLLRLWMSEQEERALWRASLENPMTGERYGFGSLERLFAFLCDRCDDRGDPADKGRNG